MKYTLLTCILFSSITLAQIASTSQGFDDVEMLPGWVFSNQSSPLGDSDWFQGAGATNIFAAQSGDANSFIAANHRNTRGTPEISATICNYLIMPDLGSLESVSFYTRSRIANNNFTVFPDRLYMVYSPTGAINTGNCIDDFGDFTDTLLVINPEHSKDNHPDGYPLTDWEQFSSAINGSGRVAFVYFVENAGFFGANSNYLGIDTVEWVLAPTPVNQLSNAWK